MHATGDTFSKKKEKGRGKLLPCAGVLPTRRRHRRISVILSVPFCPKAKQAEGTGLPISLPQVEQRDH